MSNDYIYSSLSDDIVGATNQEAKESLRVYLSENSGVFYKAKELSKKCGFKPSATSVEFRKAVTELIEIDCYPIVANNSGFAWASDPNMIKFYADKLRERQLGLQRRIDAVTRIYNTITNARL